MLHLAPVDARGGMVSSLLHILIVTPVSFAILREQELTTHSPAKAKPCTIFRAMSLRRAKLTSPRLRVSLDLGTVQSRSQRTSVFQSSPSAFVKKRFVGLGLALGAGTERAAGEHHDLRLALDAHGGWKR